jgi:DsbC/DsbD-like thiol-disulfide interchange protein
MLRARARPEPQSCRRGQHVLLTAHLRLIPSVTAEGWQIYPRLPGAAGLPYYSIWQQEVSVFQSIPQEAILGFVR